MAKRQLLPEFDKENKVSMLIEGWPIKPVKVSNIIENPDNLRVLFNHEAMQRLVKSIQTTGLAYPLLGHPATDNSKVELLDGHRRIRAIRTLGWDMVPVILSPYRLNKEQAQTIMLLTDSTDLPWNKYDHAKHCAVVFQTTPTMSVAAERVGMSLSQFQSHLAVGLLESFVIKRALENRVPFEFTAQSASKFATNALSKKIGMSKSEICGLLVDKYIQGKMQPVSQFNACLLRLKNIPVADIKYWLQSDNGVAVLTAMVNANTDTRELTDNLVKSLGHIEAKMRDNANRLTEEDVQRIRNSIALIQRVLKHTGYINRRDK